ncbi:MAG: ExbD/TolR family protein [Alkalilacustris sp.]
MKGLATTGAGGPARRPLALRPARRRAGVGDVVPMINIVFLLLIFFLMAATLAPPDPLEVRPPVASGRAPGDAGGPTLHVDAGGALVHEGIGGEAVFGALASLPEGTVLRVHADAGLDGAAFARLLGRIAQAGVAEVSVVVVAP